jgi:phage protein D
LVANRWAPWVRLSTPSVLLPFTVIEWVVHAEENCHPWAQLTLRYQMSAGFRAAADQLPPSLWWPENLAVQVSWGSTPATQSDFFGYVVSPELISHPATQQQPYVPGQMLDVRYTLLGASKVLQTASTRTWRNCSVEYMAQQIAAENGLAAVTDPHARVFDQRIQAAQSDFRFLQDRAAEAGYRLSVDETALYLTDPRRQLVSASPDFRQARTPGMADTMQTFQAVVGETDPAGAIRAAHTAVAISATGIITQAQAQTHRSDLITGADVAPQVGRVSSGYVSGSHADAAAVTAAAALSGLWWVHATATTDGDVRLRPGCVVTLGGSAVPGQYAGAWMTRSAHHRIVVNPLDNTRSTYHADLVLGRDQVAGLSLLPWRASPQYASATVNGRWTAQRLGVR